MNKKHKEMIGRIFLGILILTILVIIIIPRPQKKIVPSTTITQSQQQKPVVMHTVSLTSNGFEPKKITIKKGEVVIWTNKSGKEAGLNSDNHPTHKLYPVLNLGEFGNGLSVQARIYRIGELTYHNHLNPSQKGTIVVVE